MAKANLTFDLESPEDKIIFQKTLMAEDMHRVLWDLDQQLRHKIKYNDTEAEGHLSKDAENALQEARDMLHRLLDENNVDIYL